MANKNIHLNTRHVTTPDGVQHIYLTFSQDGMPETILAEFAGKQALDIFHQILQGVIKGEVKLTKNQTVPEQNGNIPLKS